MAEREKPRSDPNDGLPAMPVGSWAQEKHALLKLYIEIARGVRAKFVGAGKAGATFIDLFSGPGRAYVKGTDTFLDGSPIVAWKASRDCAVPFTTVYLNDANAALVDAAYIRLNRLGANAVRFSGAAEQIVKQIVRQLSPHALHLAFLDPFNLEMPFDILAALAGLKRMDLLVHVSAMDLQRNWAAYASMQHSVLDDFAPGWRDQVDLSQPEETARLAFIDYWVGRLRGLGFDSETRFRLITGQNGQPLYWLVLVAKHQLAAKFWKESAPRGKTKDMF